tara:strand:- start:5 stop:403 length:399 start_codon:yes stop_codon:yes gene_type:complete
MAITKTLIEATPYEDASNQVEHWDLTMKYKQGDTSIDSETGETIYAANYYENNYSTTVHATESVYVSSDEGVPTFTTITNFTELDKTAWSLAELIALCPTTQWDSIFDSQYDSVITNPPTTCTPDDSFVIPS